MKKNYLWLLLMTLLVSACAKEENPFPDTGSGGSTSAVDNTDPNGISGLHKNIFSVKCANPSCHGGTFEPDFRTVESSYYTLVYQPVIQNTLSEKYTYRVVPRDTNNSWLYHRVTKGDSLNPRMPIYMDALTTEERMHIKNWIMNGAPDARGVLPSLANLPPKVAGYNAYDAAYNRIDIMRSSWSEAFPATHGQQLNLWVFVDDMETEDKKLLLNEMKFSLDPNDFSNAVTASAVWKNGPVCWGWVVSIQTAQFPAGAKVYMRYYVKDPLLNQVIEMPKNTSYSYYKRNFSFQL